MYILGISAYYHDSSAALLHIDGEKVNIIAACQEERFTRKKFDPSFPKHSIQSCLDIANISADQVDYFCFYEKPWITFERLIETYLSESPRGLYSFLLAMPQWLSKKLNLKSVLKKELQKHFQIKSANLLFSDHHLSHAASAFFASPYSEAAVLCMDGVGEWATTTTWMGQKNNLSPLQEIHFPHSLGLLYSAFTYFTGFKVNSGEYKLMGLAPYGDPKYVQTIKDHLIDIKEDGSFRLNLKYFDYLSGLKMTSPAFHQLFGHRPRESGEDLRQIDVDLAASIQSVTEEVVLKIARSLKAKTQSENLCLAGGVALNCVANGKLQAANIFKNIWIQPAAGDSGGSLGAALAAAHIHLQHKRTPAKEDLMQAGFLGPKYSTEHIEEQLTKNNLKYTKYTDFNTAAVECAKILAAGAVIGNFQGRMEYGPRALGHRSILGDPRIPDMQNKMNLKIKFRESFRPFAPAILEEDLNSYFKLQQPSPYMMVVADVADHLQKNPDTPLNGLEKRNFSYSELAAITHVDHSARVQSVNKQQNPIFYTLIHKFKELTNCPVLINTSFNVRGEPIVNTPQEAIDCFLNTDIDYLFIDCFLINKKDQAKLTKDLQWRNKFDLD